MIQEVFKLVARELQIAFGFDDGVQYLLNVIFGHEHAEQIEELFFAEILCLQMAGERNANGLEHKRDVLLCGLVLLGSICHAQKAVDQCLHW